MIVSEHVVSPAQALVESFHTFLVLRMVTISVHLIDLAALVFTASAWHQIFCNKSNILLEFRHHSHCSIGKFDATRKVSAEQSWTANVA